MHRSKGGDCETINCGCYSNHAGFSLEFNSHQTAHTRSYPSHLIRMVVPIPVGGTGDMNGRALTGEAGKILGQQIVMTNKPSAPIRATVPGAKGLRPSITT
jgi:hypothetical protein